MHRPLARALLVALLLLLAGCGMMGEVFEDRVLRVGVILLAVGAVVGFIASRMRRP